MSANDEQPKDQQPESAQPESAQPESVKPESISSPVTDFEMPDVLLPESQPQVPPPPKPSAPAVRRRKGRLRPIIGMILVVFGVLFLGRNLGWFSWFEWSDWWPVILIIIGFLLVFRRSRR